MCALFVPLFKFSPKVHTKFPRTFCVIVACVPIGSHCIFYLYSKNCFISAGLQSRVNSASQIWCSLVVPKGKLNVCKISEGVRFFLQVFLQVMHLNETKKILMKLSSAEFLIYPKFVRFPEILFNSVCQIY